VNSAYLMAGLPSTQQESELHFSEYDFKSSSRIFIRVVLGSCWVMFFLTE
jgi:hypothetical protein